MNHSRQHWVPRFYLEAWCDPETPKGHEPFVWLWAKDGSTCKRKAPAKTFTEKNLYTLGTPEGTRDLRLEHGLAGLESDFANTRRAKLETAGTLTPREREVVIAFMAAMHARSRAQLRHWSAELGRIVALGERMKDAYARATPEQGRAMEMTLSTGKGASLEEVREIAEHPQKLLYTTIGSEFAIMRKMSLAVMEAPEGSGFITADVPVVWIDPTAHKRPPGCQSFGLGFKTVEVMMPVSPRLLLHMSWQDDFDRRRFILPSAAVEEVNRTVRFHCQEYFVTNGDSKNEYWFQDLEQPN